MRQFVTKIPKQHRVLIAATSVFLSVVLLLPSEQAAASKSSKADSLEIGKRYSLALPEQADVLLPEQSITELAPLPEEDISLN